jgi:hypothetical protein
MSKLHSQKGRVKAGRLGAGRIAEVLGLLTGSPAAQIVKGIQRHF